MITCLRCHKDKDDTEFNQHRGKEKQSWCRECTTEYSRRWYEANRQSHIEYVSSHRKRKIHLCKNCGRGEPDVKFYIKRQDDHYYRRFICYDCDREYKKKYPKKEDALKREAERRKARSRIHRQRPDRRFMYILRDSTRSDSKYGRENDLDADFVKSLIANDCTYCGNHKEKITLDRIDNNIGHTKVNVVPACLSCNMFRRNMPYKAWLLLVPALRRARKLGLLDGWMSGTLKTVKSRTTVEKDAQIVNSL